MKPISELSPLEIREAVATRVMGWTKTRGGNLWMAPDAPHMARVCPHYESEIDPAFEVVAKMRKKGWDVRIFGIDDGWFVELSRPNLNAANPEWEVETGSHDSLPMAICLAALEATGSAK